MLHFQAITLKFWKRQKEHSVKPKALFSQKLYTNGLHLKRPIKTNLEVSQRSGNHVTFDFGYSFQFLTHARYVLISVFTTGREFEKKLQHTSSKGDPLDAYFLDLIGLTALEKAGQTIKKIAEKQAGKLGWGVSPFLSPGSVHGWDLANQMKLCSLLPLEKIDVTFQNDSVLSPLKTVSCLIGTGPGYRSVHVGTTCQVCSKKDTCPMKQKQTPGTNCMYSAIP